MKPMRNSAFNQSTPIIVSVGLIDMLRKQCGRRWRDALALYEMYCYHAIRQGTSSVYATDGWMAGEMQMSHNTFRSVKSLLVQSGLITTIHKNNPVTGEIKWYVAVKFAKSSKVVVAVSDSPMLDPEPPATHPESDTTHPKSGQLATHPENQVTGFEKHSLIGPSGNSGGYFTA